MKTARFPQSLKLELKPFEIKLKNAFALPVVEFGNLAQLVLTETVCNFAVQQRGRVAGLQN